MRGWGRKTAYCLFAMLGASLIEAAESPPPAIGSKAPDLSFKDIRYLPRRLSELGAAKAYVLAITSNSCPQNRATLETLAAIDKTSRAKGVIAIAVFAQPDDSIREMAADTLSAASQSFSVKDADGSLAAALGVPSTGAFVILDGSRMIRFRGAGKNLAAALDAVLAGQQPSPAETPVAGEPLRKPRPLPTESLTYAEHIAPIMNKHCAECHRPGTEAPFALLSHADAVNHAETIAEVVGDERMPPWYASRKHGQFTNDRRLPDLERARLVAWAKGDRAPGDLSKAPAPPTFSTSKWTIGEPDLVVSTQTYTLPKTGFVPYKYAVLRYVFPHDTWIQGAEILPDNPAVVHHCNMAYAKLGEKWSRSNFIIGRVPGVQSMNLSHGLAYFIPKGAILILQIHFTTTGKDESCAIRVGFRYPRETIVKQFKMLWMVDDKFAIPPGDPAHRVVGVNKLNCNAIGYGLFCHMHVRGRDMTFVAKYPGGEEETLLMIPNYNFDWQMGYQFGAGRRFPKGTTLSAVAHYDNSPFNPYNPDPKATVREGDQTVEEMLNGVFFYIDEDERLNIDVDPKTGKQISGGAPSKAG